ncbi:unnamed protein product [Didymodactylos carnosus]|uniref:Uncharacterized protein n=1 Tax=Didymodactylos carnosus TaxID=1234261 RepID=A0A813UP97_9BILA|nr:unnamed protein product [Didymodactylos carnosus]CAF1385831.1 unnamed protein product [Didymodactylos carnosus]CAF3619030.1 unnamed protein product [Didymodactylos carnosus]CAF4193878.1 unnamed protein product [Didymodactylos carnosus]
MDCSSINSTQLQTLYAEGKSCQFILSQFQNTKTDPCIKEKNFEYDRGHPCVLLKLNKIYDWVPITYENVAEVPENLKSIWDVAMSEYVLVQCNGENDVDRDFIYELEYSSPLRNLKIGGFPKYYFPRWLPITVDVCLF